MHCIDNLGTDANKNVSNFIINPTGFDAFKNKRSILSLTKLSILKVLINAVDAYNTNNIKYNVIYFDDPTQSPDGKSHFVFY